MSKKAFQKGFLVLLLAIVILLPRIVWLDHFVNTDERKWLTRSANFYYALTQGDFEHTFQREHPGVSIMWAGTAGFLWHYPAYVQEAAGYLGWNEEELEPFLRAQGYEPLDLLIAARFFLALMTTITLVAAFFVATRLLGWFAALGGFVLIAFDPFHLALSRMLHLDALMSSLMLLSLLAFLNYGLRSTPHGAPWGWSSVRRQRGADLFLSGVAAGVAWLTKSPSFFLIPFMGLLGLALMGQEYSREYGVSSGLLWNTIKRLSGWAVVGALIYVLLWPAMWVNPLGTLWRVLEQALFYADSGHGTQIYFNGSIYQGDPGWIYYPLTYLWRTTPVVLFGLLLAALAYGGKWSPLERKEVRHVVAVLTLFALLFTLFMTLGSKKAERYLIPIYLPLDLIAGLGWMATARLLATYFFKKRVSVARVGAMGLLTVVLIGQALVSLPLLPYAISYYNPLFGGGPKAAQTLMIGWGEGLEEAARYLNQKPDGAALRVASWYESGSFSYFFQGEALSHSFEHKEDISRWFETDYIVLYMQQWQRQLPNPAFLDYFTTQTPEHVIEINGMEYAKIYDVRSLLPPAFLAPGQARFTDWDGAIRLIAYELPTDALSAGNTFQAAFYLQNMAPLEENLNVLLRIVGQDGREWLRDEGWPFGSPTSQWQMKHIWRDGHEFTMPVDAPAGYYHVMMSFYDPATFDSLSATDTLTGEPLGEVRLIDYLVVGDLPAPLPAITPMAPSKLGPDIHLSHFELIGSDGQPVDRLIPGATFHIRLFWQTDATIKEDYTVFVHLIGSDGQLMAQQDQPPLAGFLPTQLWRPNETIVDQVTLTIPPDAPTDTYQLHIGMYDSTTLQRLPVTQAEQPLGDSIRAGTIEIE